MLINVTNNKREERNFGQITPLMFSLLTFRLRFTERKKLIECKRQRSHRTLIWILISNESVHASIRGARYRLVESNSELFAMLDTHE